ncbi:MAG: signal peptidase I [Acidimicrobiales bacterium]|jgi:signal peptidase I
MDDDELHVSAPPRRPNRFLPWITIIVVAMVIAIGLRLYVVQTFFVPSGSMIPTLMPGDRILVQKIGYSVTEGAIVVFRTPPGYSASECGGTAETDLVKRVIGLPGDTIWSRGNTVYVNGKPLAEPYLPKGQLLGAPVRREKIPAGHYFMMGDNRPISCDSRVWGLVPSSDVVGRVFLVIWRDGHPVFHPI